MRGSTGGGNLPLRAYVYPVNGEMYKLAVIMDHVPTEHHWRVETMIHKYHEESRKYMYNISYNIKFVASVKKLCKLQPEVAGALLTAVFLYGGHNDRFIKSDIPEAHSDRTPGTKSLN